MIGRGDPRFLHALVTVGGKQALHTLMIDAGGTLGSQLQGVQGPLAV